MIAEYKGCYYFVNKKSGSDFTLVTYNIQKASLRDFKRNEYGSFFKDVKIEDKDVISLYEIKFYAEYARDGKVKALYNINSKNTVASIMHDKVVLCIPDDDEITYKSVNVGDCKGLYVERRYIKQAGRILDEIHIEKAKMENNINDL